MKALAQHLLKEENDHVDVHELRGFASDNLTGALAEAQAISRGTRCKQYLYSLSFNPPPGEDVSTAAFESAIGRAEERLGLTDQPRAIVFHEKEGRRHCHVVWSRIDADEMKAVHLPFTKQKLQELSRDLYIEHGWKMPRGLMQSGEHDPRNFSLAEWQQARRVGRDPRDVKAALQDCWATSDSRQSLAVALEERGFKLAKGDRRAVVAVDAHGEVYALARWAGVKSKDVRAKVGDEEGLPSVAQSKEELAGQVSARLRELGAQQSETVARRLAEAQQAKVALVKEQRAAREDLAQLHAGRWAHETQARQERFSGGLLGFFHRLIGRHERIRTRNEIETLCAFQRDRGEKDALIFSHLQARQAQRQLFAGREEQSAKQQQELGSDIERFEAIRQEARRTMLEEFRARRGDTPTTESLRSNGNEVGQDRMADLDALREKRREQVPEHSSGPALEQ